ncbi:GntR family transcriptional regulator [Bordetella pertussis]|nr:GntR family transcriptional regulator [Bordetella pertussis]
MRLADQLYGQIFDQIASGRLNVGDKLPCLTRTGSRQRAQRVADEHAAILGAIREQDAERARIAMQFHLGQARHRLVDRDKD